MAARLEVGPVVLLVGLGALLAFFVKLGDLPRISIQVPRMWRYGLAYLLLEPD